jgi:hypothetical protein
MKKSWGLPIMLVMILLMSSSSGCLGLLQMRETMEDLREAPELKTETIRFNHEKIFDTIQIEEYQNTSSIYIDESVSEIVIYRQVTLLGSGVIGCMENFTRYVRAELYTPTGVDPVWSIDVCENLGPVTVDIVPNPTFETGNWRLEIIARAQGTPNSAFQDKLEINITIKRTCIEYPLEESCI